MNDVRRLLLFLLAAVAGWSLQAVAAELEFYVTPSKAPPGSLVKSLPTVTGGSAPVALPPIATIKPEDVLGLRGTAASAERYPGLGAVTYYRVVLVLKEKAQDELQKAIDEYCKSQTYVTIAMDETILDGIALRDCARIEAAVTFESRQSAEDFVKRFTDQPLLFTAPTPTSVGGASRGT